MPDPTKIVPRDKVRFPERARFTAEDMERFTDNPKCTECICSGFSLKELYDIAKQEDWTWQQVMSATGAGAECEVCVPYIKRAVETGETEILIDPNDTGMYIHQDGILEKEPPVLAKSNMDPAKLARVEALAKDDEKDAGSIKTEIE